MEEYYQHCLATKNVRNLMVALQSTDTLLFFLLIHKYYQLREVKNNVGDVTKAHFVALSMFDIYSETKSDRILLPERRI